MSLCRTLCCAREYESSWMIVSLMEIEKFSLMRVYTQPKEAHSHNHRTRLNYFLAVLERENHFHQLPSTRNLLTSVLFLLSSTVLKQLLSSENIQKQPRNFNLFGTFFLACTPYIHTSSPACVRTGSYTKKEIFKYFRKILYAFNSVCQKSSMSKEASSATSVNEKVEQSCVMCELIKCSACFLINNVKKCENNWKEKGSD